MPDKSSEFWSRSFRRLRRVGQVAGAITALVGLGTILFRGVELLLRAL